MNIIRFLIGGFGSLTLCLLMLAGATSCGDSRKPRLTETQRTAVGIMMVHLTALEKIYGSPQTGAEDKSRQKAGWNELTLNSIGSIKGLQITPEFESVMKLFRKTADAIEICGGRARENKKIEADCMQAKEGQNELAGLLK